MKQKTQWSFEESKKWQGFNDHAIERFKKGRYLSLAREVIQNSNDALFDSSKPVRVDFELFKVPVSTIPGIDGLRHKVECCLPHAKEDNNPEAEKWFLEAQKILGGSSVNVLKMADFNTSGMTAYPNRSAIVTNSGSIYKL